LRPTSDPEDQVPVFMSPSDRVAQLYSPAPGSLFVTFYDSLVSNSPPHGTNSILSPQYLPRSFNDEAPRYVIFSNFLPLLVYSDILRPLFSHTLYLCFLSFFGTGFNFGLLRVMILIRVQKYKIASVIRLMCYGAGM
jgi:hypothetical protein